MNKRLWCEIWAHLASAVGTRAGLVLASNSQPDPPRLARHKQFTAQASRRLASNSQSNPRYSIDDAILGSNRLSLRSSVAIDCLRDPRWRLVEGHGNMVTDPSARRHSFFPANDFP